MSITGKTRQRKFLSALLILVLLAFSSPLFAATAPEPEEAQPSLEYLDWLEEQEAINNGLIDPDDIEKRL